MVGGDDEGARAEGLEGEAGGGFPRGIIEVGEGLVEDDEGGVMGQRSGQLDAAALTAGKLGDGAVEEAGRVGKEGVGRDKVYFPLSDHWRKREMREADCTERISNLIAAISN